MTFVLSAVLVPTILLLIFLLRSKDQHHSAGYSSDSYLSCGDLSIALREVCRDMLTPKTSVFLNKNAPVKVVALFGKQQQQLAQYSLRVASETLFRNLPRNNHGRSSFSRETLGRQPSDARRLFLLTACTVGRIELGVLRSLDWSLPRSVQAWISAKTLMGLGILLDERTSEPPLRPQRSAV